MNTSFLCGSNNSSSSSNSCSGPKGVGFVSLKELNRSLRLTVDEDAARKSRRNAGVKGVEYGQNKRKSERIENRSESQKERKRELQSVTYQRRKRKQSEVGTVTASKRSKVDIVAAGSSANADAERFLKKFDSKTQFHACGVCGSDEGTEKLQVLDEVMLAVVETSDLPVLYGKVVKLLEDGGSLYEEYVRSIKQEFNENGLLRNSRFICRDCCTVLRKRTTARSRRNVGGYRSKTEEEDTHSLASDNGYSCTEKSRWNVGGNSSKAKQEDTHSLASDDGDSCTGKLRWNVGGYSSKTKEEDTHSLASDDGDSCTGKSRWNVGGYSSKAEQEDTHSLAGDDGDSCEEKQCEMNVSVRLNVPRMSYLQGLYPGVVPLELKDLRLVEVSMISIYNPITRLKLNSKGMSYKYYHGSAHTYTIVNDVSNVASHLPWVPSINTFAILRYKNDVCVKELKYRPSAVKKALNWLKLHNHLYSSIIIEYPPSWSELDEESELEPESMVIDELEEDMIRAEASFVGVPHDSHTGDDSAVADTSKDVLLVQDTEIVSQLESLRNAVNKERCRKQSEKVPTIERSSADNVYVNVYGGEQYYWEKCFPTLYPYGRGGPGDDNYRVANMAEYFKHTLRRGGGKDGRRFQNNAAFIFAAYTYVIRKQISGMSYAATRDDSTATTKALTSQAVVSTLLDCLTQGSEDEPLDIDTLYERAKQRQAVSNRSEDSDDMKVDGSEESTSNARGGATGSISRYGLSEGSASTMVDGNTELTAAATASQQPLVNDSEVLDQVKNLMQRLVPFATQPAGTPMHMNFERLNMLAMITAPCIVSKSQWRWFMTFAFPDKQYSRLYENLLPESWDLSDWSDREDIIVKYSEKVRVKLLREHPALVARIFHELQECIWDYVIMGSDHPVGVVEDYMRRVEFQARGTPHVHALVAVKHDGIVAEDITSEEPTRKMLVRELVRNTATCILQHPEGSNEDAEERDYFWRPVHLPPSTAIEDYENDVRRLVFRPTMDFRLDEDNEFISSETKHEYYRYQITNQMHRCTPSCEKYEYSRSGECRFHYPVSEEWASNTDSTIYTLYDKKKRTQTKIYPPRSNGWLNPLPVRPLLVFANQGNMDIQYISNVHGAVEYTCGYISKNEEPDERTLINVFSKKLAQAILRSDTGDATTREKLRSAGAAFAASQQVGTVQCVYTLLKLPLVKLSRPVCTISPAPTTKLTKSIVTDIQQLQQMNPNDSTVSTSARSHAGRRLAYHLLCQQQYNKFGACRVSLSTIQSNYAISKPQRKKRDGTRAETVEPKLLETNTIGEIEHLQEPGYAMFDVGEYRFKASSKPVVLRMSPYIRTNEKEEQSAYAMLLLYVPWPKEGEENLLRGNDTAVEAFHQLREHNELPQHVLTQISCTEKSEELLNDIGAVTYTIPNNEEGVDHNNILNDDNEDDEIMSDANVVVVNEDTGDVSIDSSGNNEDNTVIMTSLEDYAIESVDGMQVVPEHVYNYYSQYINNQNATYMNKYVEENSSSSTSTHARNSDVDDRSSAGRVPLPREEERKAALQQRVARLTNDQRAAYEAMKEYIVNSERTEQTMLQFITGGAGVGKSEVLSCIIEMARLHYGKRPGLYGSVLIMGPTGAAAHHVNGFTWQSVCLKGKKDTTTRNQTRYLSQQKAETLYDRIKGVKVIVIDEISMVSSESLEEINRRLCEAVCTSIPDPKERAKINSKPFAGLPAIFCGDLYQLGCVGGTPVYYTTRLNTHAMRGQNIWRQINLYNNLKTSTRFHQTTHADTNSNGSTSGNIATVPSIATAASTTTTTIATTNTTVPASVSMSSTTNNTNTPFSPLETFLRGARIGHPASHYIDLLNAQQLCINYVDAYNKCHPKAIWLTSTNKEKDPINKFMYERLKESGNYTMDVVAKHTRNNCPNEHLTRKEKEMYYAMCGTKTAPVVLHLAIGSRVKIKENLGTQIGVYNGALGTVVRFLFDEKCPPKEAKPPFADIKYRPIPIVLVQLDEDVGYTCLPGVPNVVPIKEFSSHLCEGVNRLQLPLVVAHACTIHSVQGLTADHGVTLLPATTFNAQGLMYVACSRPRTLEQLWLLKPLRKSHFEYGGNVYQKIKEEYDRLDRVHNAFT